MRIRRILTNNALVVLDENGKEQIVCGRGIGYKKRPGDDADDSLVDAVYVKEGDQSFEQIRKTLEALPEEYLLLAQHILTAANVSLNMKLNRSWRCRWPTICIMPSSVFWRGRPSPTASRGRSGAFIRKNMRSA